MQPASLLLTDLYELTMLHAYRDHGMDGIAVFELFMRKLPPSRNFLLAAGLEQALQFLETARFTPDELEWLSSLGRFPKDFIDYLSGWHFSGDVHAMQEGTVFFADEPVLRVTAPIDQAQLVESRLLNLIHFQTLIASKAARCVLAAPGKRLVDFGMRRAHGAEAALYSARAAYIAGFEATATVLAGEVFGIPIAGTMAHSFVQAHDSERDAFMHFAESWSGNTVLLIDTYDTERAAQVVVELAPELHARNISIAGVRIDSGNLADHARRVREILDRAGLRDVTIFSSSSLDEWSLQRFVTEQVPIDGFGVGTHLDTSSDAPYLDGVYKLVKYAGLPRYKRSEHKLLWPGAKQVFRGFDDQGVMMSDVIALEDETAQGTPLLQKVMEQGKRLGPEESLDPIRARAAAEYGRLAGPLRALTPAHYTVTHSDELQSLLTRMRQ